MAWDGTVSVAAIRELKWQAGGAPYFRRGSDVRERITGQYPVLAATDRGILAVWTAGSDPSRVQTLIAEKP